jgi:hypothetical protein
MDDEFDDEEDDDDDNDLLGEIRACGCGCGKKLEHKAYKSCTQCKDKDTSIASNKIRLSCWAKDMHCIACSDAERYNSLIAPAFFNGYKKM